MNAWPSKPRRDQFYPTIRWGRGNSYIVIANTQGYNEKAGVAFSSGSLSTNVHNTYRLVAAETGFFGLFAFLLLLLHPMVVAFDWGWRARGDLRGDLLLGLGIALIIVYLHSFYDMGIYPHLHLPVFFCYRSRHDRWLSSTIGLPKTNQADVTRNPLDAAPACKET